MAVLKLITAFSRVAAKAKGGLSGEEFLEMILRERPDLKEKIDSGKIDVRFPAQGGMAHTVFIGNEVFKGSIWKEGGIFAKYNRDLECLQQLQGISNVPKITYINKEHNFYGMSLIPGVPLREVLDTLSPAEVHDIARGMADFIADMALAIPPKNGRYVRHDDLHPGNIIIDPETKKLSGIIDFGVFRYFPKNELGSLSARVRGSYIRSGFADMIEQEFESRKTALPDLAVAKKHRLWFKHAA